MKVIGLTGPIGAGKSEAAKVLARQGAYVVDADEIGHKLFVPQSDIWCRILKGFGSGVLNRGGQIDRKKLGEVVFSDPKKIKLLNSITHPAIKRKIEEEIAEKKWRGKIVVVNAALPDLFKGLVDKVLVVVASEKKRLARLVKKGISPAEAKKKMKMQMSNEDYIKIADVIINNDETLNDMELLIKEFLLSLKTA